jgi:hypothetical protein
MRPESLEDAGWGLGWGFLSPMAECILNHWKVLLWGLFEPDGMNAS